MGKLYMDGIEGERKNPEEAVVWFKKAAENNFPQAYYQLGLVYESGSGVRKDVVVAKDYFKKAAKSGLEDAEIALTRLDDLTRNIDLAEKTSRTTIEARPVKTPTGTNESVTNLPSGDLSFVRKILDGQFSSEGIRIKTPDLAEIGAVVPIEISIAAPVVEGETLYIVVNDKYVSHTVRPYGQVGLQVFSVRSRMPSTGYLRGVVIDKKGNIKAASKEVRVTVGDDMSSSEGAGRFVYKIHTDKSYNKAAMKMLLSSPMSSVNYVKAVRISYPGYGYIETDLTPAASKNPFLAVVATGTESFNRYEIEFVLSDGQRHTGGGEF